MRTTRFACAVLLLSAATLVTASVSSAAPLTGGTGPGGIGVTGAGGDLVIWMRGDTGLVFGTGTNVATWNDQSGRNNNFAQTTPANQPNQSTTINGVPVVSFTGANADRMENLAVTGLANLGGVMVFGLFDSDEGGTPDVYFMSSQTPGGQSSFPHVENYNSNGGYHWLTAGYSNIWRYGAGSAVTGSPQVVVQGFDGSQAVNTNRLAIRVDGTSYVPTPGDATTLPTTNNNATQLRLGSWITGAFNVTGKIGETFIYNSALNLAQQTVIENYLSSKFNVNPLASDHYVGDTAPNGNFDFGVFGVGSDGSGPVLSSGFEGMGLQIPSATSGQWVFAGHANGPNGTTSSDMPGGQRWERSWFVDATNVTSADLAFDWNDAGVTAAFDASFNGLFYRQFNSGVFTQIASGIVDIGNQRVDFSGVVFPTEDGYYTLGFVPMVPEPSTFALLGLGVIGLVVRRRRRAA